MIKIIERLNTVSSLLIPPLPPNKRRFTRNAFRATIQEYGFLKTVDMLVNDTFNWEKEVDPYIQYRRRRTSLLYSKEEIKKIIIKTIAIIVDEPDFIKLHWKEKLPNNNRMVDEDCDLEVNGESYRIRCPEEGYVEEYYCEEVYRDYEYCEIWYLCETRICPPEGAADPTCYGTTYELIIEPMDCRGSLYC
ncbi:MAG: hypothetical protein ACFFCI_25730 [Promethearchaeota archaeon]